MGNVVFLMQKPPSRSSTRAILGAEHEVAADEVGMACCLHFGKVSVERRDRSRDAREVLVA